MYKYWVVPTPKMCDLCGHQYCQGNGLQDKIAYELNNKVVSAGHCYLIPHGTKKQLLTRLSITTDERDRERYKIAIRLTKH